MPFQGRSVMDEKREFVMLALAEGANVSALCARFGIGRTSAYKLIGRFKEQGAAGLAEHSRRPKLSPRRSPAETEVAVMDLRARHPAWGGRKIAKRLEAVCAVAGFDGDRHPAPQRV